ncbi:hypothetical protein KZZ08_22820 [Roseovarius mucosus]|uniref:hypothetical protein n=1 Tax=Roseovarius mucosus TaxID=215743 RepID=UPI001C5CD053|nr:hypothetical protein [Roseovarius mucosus]MBW4976448.1 hypothetical protein [Roseovarius mucosus]
MDKRFPSVLIALILTTSGVEGFTLGMGSWLVQKVEVSEEEGSDTPPGQYCYLTNKKKRDAFSLVIDKDGVVQMRAWLSNIELPKALAVRDIYIRFYTAGGDEKRLWALSNTIVRDTSDLGLPGDVYLWHIFDHKVFGEPGSPEPQFLRDFLISIEGSLSFVNSNGDKVSEFDMGGSYNGVKKLRECYDSIKAPDPRKQL